MGEVILMAQLTWEFHLFLLFLDAIRIVCGFMLVLISLPFLSSLLFPTGLLIAFERSVQKHLHFGVRGQPLLPPP